MLQTSDKQCEMEASVARDWSMKTTIFMHVLCLGLLHCPFGAGLTISGCAVSVLPCDSLVIVVSIRVKM